MLASRLLPRYGLLMLVQLKSAIPRALAAELVAELEAASLEDGRATNQTAGGETKRNRQLTPDSAQGARLGVKLVEALRGNAELMEAARPKVLLPPIFARYDVGMGYGSHLDAPTMAAPGGGAMRTDLSMTVFLQDAAEYDGGELVMDTDFGERPVRGDAGDLVLYPSSTIHRVHAVTRGTRWVAVSWIQSMVRDATQRRVLYDISRSARALERAGAPQAAMVLLRRAEHTLLRMWASP